MRQKPYSRTAMDFRAIFAHAPPSSVDLLSKMLRFSAGSRISMFEARGHRFHEDGTSAAALQSITEEQVAVCSVVSAIGIDV